MQFIQKNSDPKPGSLFLFDGPGGPKISLSEGLLRFKETIDILKNMKSLPPLEQCDDLNVKVPKNVTKWSKREVFAE